MKVRLPKEARPRLLIVYPRMLPYPGICEKGEKTSLGKPFLPLMHTLGITYSFKLTLYALPLQVSTLGLIIMAHQVRTISKQRLGDILGYLSDSRIQGEVRQAVKDHLGLD